MLFGEYIYQETMLFGEYVYQETMLFGEYIHKKNNANIVQHALSISNTKYIIIFFRTNTIFDGIYDSLRQTGGNLKISWHWRGKLLKKR